MSTRPATPTLYLYRGIVIYWYKINHRDGRVQYSATWEWRDTWHSTPAFQSVDRALIAAEKRIDHQQANRPAQRGATHATPRP